MTITDRNKIEQLIYHEFLNDSGYTAWFWSFEVQTSHQIYSAIHLGLVLCPLTDVSLSRQN